MPATGITPRNRVASLRRRARSSSFVDFSADPGIVAAGLDALDSVVAPIREGPAAVELR